MKSLGSGVGDKVGRGVDVGGSAVAVGWAIARVIVAVGGDTDGVGTETGVLQALKPMSTINPKWA